MPQRDQPAPGAGRSVARCGSGGQAGEQLAQRGSGGAVGLAQQGQGLGLDIDAQRRVGRARLGAGVAWNLAPLPVVRPQVGRVNAVGAGQLLHRTVLREQRQR